MTHSISEEYALKVNGLSYNLPNGTTLLNSVSFNLHAGEILALVGLNGSGKTTLIRLLAGLLVPSLGNISFSNRAFEGLSITERARQIAYFGQHDDADGRLLVNDFVGLGLFPHRSSLSSKEIKNRIEDALDRVGLFEKSNYQIAQLSGGERQRAKFARAVCQAPKLLLLDEPTNHLDPAAKGALLTAAMQLGITVVTALHDLTLIDDFATHVAVLKDGSLAGFGHPSDIINPQIIQEIFGVQMFRLQHPNKQRMLSSLDVMMGGQNRFFVNKKSSLTNRF